MASLDLYKLVEDRWELEGLSPGHLLQESSERYFDDAFWPDDLLND